MSLTAVFQIGSLGDSIVSVPALLSIKDLAPPPEEYLLVSRFDSPLNAMPNHIYDMAWRPKAQINYRGPSRGPRQLLSIAALVRQLRRHRPSRCVYLMPADRSQRQVDRDKLFFKLGGVKELIGFRALTSEELASRPNCQGTEAYLRLKRIWGEHADEKFARYSSAPILHPSEAAENKVRHWLQTERRYPDRRLVAVCPYSNSPSKDIPDQLIINLLPRLEEASGTETIFLGGKKDFARVQNLIDRAGIGLNACGLPVEEAAAILKVSSLALCADSGPMHLAGALGVPSVVAFSRMNKQLRRWFPLGHGHIILYREVQCAGCRSFKCPVEDHPCMREITVDQILAVALSKLNGYPVDPASLSDTQLAAW